MVTVVVTGLSTRGGGVRCGDTARRRSGTPSRLGCPGRSEGSVPGTNRARGAAGGPMPPLPCSTSVTGSRPPITAAGRAEERLTLGAVLVAPPADGADRLPWGLRRPIAVGPGHPRCRRHNSGVVPHVVTPGAGLQVAEVVVAPIVVSVVDHPALGDRAMSILPNVPVKEAVAPGPGGLEVAIGVLVVDLAPELDPRSAGLLGSSGHAREASRWSYTTRRTRFPPPSSQSAHTAASMRSGDFSPGSPLKEQYWSSRSANTPTCLTRFCS